MFCSQCGAQLPDGTKFCPKCGTQLGATPAEPVQESADSTTVPSYSAPAVEAPAQPAPTAAPVSAPMTQPVAKPNKKFDPLRIGSIAACLAILASWFLAGVYANGQPISMFMVLSYGFGEFSASDDATAALIVIFSVIGLEVVGLIINLVRGGKVATVVSSVLVLLGVVVYVLILAYVLGAYDWVPGPGFFLPIVAAAALLVLCIVRLFKKKPVA